MFARHKLTKNGSDFIVLLDPIIHSKRTTQKKLTLQLQNRNIHYARVDTVFYTMPISGNTCGQDEQVGWKYAAAVFRQYLDF